MALKTTESAAAVRAAPVRATSLCLVVHDALELRLRLASLVRRANPKLDADTVTRAGFDAMSLDRLRAYCAVMLIIEFSPPEAATDPLAILARLHGQLPDLPIFVFARGGTERSAACAMKLGASDYWPIHSVVIGELASALQPLVEPASSALLRAEASDRWRQPEIAGYTLMKRIAQSALASVYLARHSEFKEPVALKIQAIGGGTPVSAAERARFTRECEILSQLNHRSIANVLDYGITEEQLYLALEYFPCGSLRDRMKHPISAVDAVNYARQMGQALQIVHAARIVHRDLKPSNLMLTDDNRLVLIDFGSARLQVADDTARAEDCIGTPYYACPEQTADAEPDARGDLYSLGVVLFEMLAGRVPYAGRNLEEVLAAHRADPIPRLPERLLAYQPIIDRLLAKNPPERYADAGEFLDALDTVPTHASRQRQDAGLRAARQQTSDILRTVKDGLFLLDQDLTIGSAHSSALGSLFQRSDFAGLSFENLLKDLVPEKTLSTALKYVGVLWTERTRENLVKSINPLGEVEIPVGDGSGKPTTRFLQFDFNRVRTGGKITHLLVSVSDVTARVDLARELRASQSRAQGQVDTLLGILHVDPANLASFLSDSSAAMRVINTVLREPAREEGAFRRKLDTLFRLVHSVKGESAALGLSSIESRAHSFEDDLQALRDRADLSGNDFLPLVIKLDDLLTHLQSVGEWGGRLSRLHAAPAPAVSHTDTTVIEDGAFVPGLGWVAVGEMLRNLTARVASEQDKDVVLQCLGFDLIPNEYRALVKDICVQAVRNSVVHGIEAAAERIALGKPAQGVLRLMFEDLGDAGYTLIAEDDGRGLSTERIKASALKKGIITPEEAQTLDARQVSALIFHPGFSTLDTATQDAGRGVGMSLMANLMQEVGGNVAVATMAGKYMRVTLNLPPRKRAATAAA